MEKKSLFYTLCEYFGTMYRNLNVVICFIVHVNLTELKIKMYYLDDVISTLGRHKQYYD